MAEAKHTSAPWRWEPRSSQVLAQRDDLNNWEVAQLGTREAFCPKGEMKEANARLIAAAPDLLEACKAVADWLSSFSMPPTSTIAEKQDHLVILNKAIVQAEGK